MKELAADKLFKICGQHDCLTKELQNTEKSRSINKTIHQNDKYLYIPRITISWTKWNHEYRINVKRKRRLDDRVLSALKTHPHPNLMRLFSYCGCLMKVEYIDGELLDFPGRPDFMLKKNMEKLICRIGSDDFNSIRNDVIKALKHLHSIGLAHTDPCPSNVMINKEGKTKLLDLSEIVFITEGEDRFDWMVLDKYFKQKFSWQERIRLWLISYLFFGVIRRFSRMRKNTDLNI